MARFVVRRLFSMIVVLFAISVLTFLIFQAIPNGDPAVRLGGRTSTPETRDAIRKDWGFDKPIYEQYGITMKKIFRSSRAPSSRIRSRSTSSTRSSAICRRRSPSR
jgi:peptide/nickel transport system permease protein